MKRSHFKLLLCIAPLVAISCAEVIPVAPPVTTTDVASYFWTGGPYNPAFLVTMGDTNATDRLNFRSITDSLIMTDGLSPRNRVTFSISAQEVAVGQFEPNHLFSLPDSVAISDAVGTSYSIVPVKVRSLLYARQGWLFAGTLGRGIWISKDDGASWARALGAVNSSVVAMCQTSTGKVFALGGDSIYYSTDYGQSFSSEFDANGPHVAITSIEDTVFIGGKDIECIRPPASMTPSTSVPTIKSGVTNSITSLTATPKKTLIAGSYQSSSTNHIFTLRSGDTVWWSPTVDAYTASQIYSLACSKGGIVFAGTIGNQILISENEGHKWTSLTSGGLGTINSLVDNPTLGTLYAGTDSGLVFTCDDSLQTTAVSAQDLPGKRGVIAMAVTSKGVLIAATDSGLCLMPSRHWITPMDTVPVSHVARFTLLKGTGDGLKKGASWQAGYLSFATLPSAKLITARVMDHLDSLVLPLPAPKAPQKDVFVVRYAVETSPTTVAPFVPYWIVYYAKGFGPVYLQLAEEDASGKLTVQSQAVYDPPQ